MNDAPITLASLPEATEQQVFDQVARHMLTQRERSLEGTNCVYRGEGGLKCAAGCLIADDEYSGDMEHHGWTELNQVGDVPGVHIGLIQGLQGIHDEVTVDQWKNKLRALAGYRQLSTEVLEQFEEVIYD